MTASRRTEKILKRRLLVLDMMRWLSVLVSVGLLSAASGCTDSGVEDDGGTPDLQMGDGDSKAGLPEGKTRDICYAPDGSLQEPCPRAQGTGDSLRVLWVRNDSPEYIDIIASVYIGNGFEQDGPDREWPAFYPGEAFDFGQSEGGRLLCRPGETVALNIAVMRDNPDPFKAMIESELAPPTCGAVYGITIDTTFRAEFSILSSPLPDEDPDDDTGYLSLLGWHNFGNHTVTLALASGDSDGNHIDMTAVEVEPFENVTNAQMKLGCINEAMGSAQYTLLLAIAFHRNESGSLEEFASVDYPATEWPCNRNTHAFINVECADVWLSAEPSASRYQGNCPSD